MTALVLWCGPVYGSGTSPYTDGDIGKVDWLGVPTKILTVQFNGSAGAGIYQSLRDGNGRVLPNLLASRGYPPLDSYDHIAACGYSAGHNFLNPLLVSDGDTIDSLVSIDACYSATNPPWTKTGYVAFATQAALGQRLAVFAATGSSHGGPGYPSSSGSECAGANFDAGAAAAGVTPVVVDSGLVHLPTVSERAGNLYLLDYALQKFPDLSPPGQIPHWYIINSLSRDIFQTYLAPWNAGQMAPGANAPNAPMSTGKAVAWGLGLAALFGVGLYAKRRWG